LDHPDCTDHLTDDALHAMIRAMPLKITDALLAEHVVFHNLFDHLERTLPHLKSLAEVRALAGVMEALVQAHGQVEDELILAPLDHCIAQLGQQEPFHEEHEEIGESLRQALKASTLREARRCLQKAVLESRSHFDKEERILFPMAEKLLKTKTLATLAETWKKQRKAITG